MSLKSYIPYSQFLTLKRIHSEPQYLLEAQIHMYFFFIWREYPHDIVLDAWRKTSKITREQLLSQTKNNKDIDTPLMFITTYSSANHNLKELFANICPILADLVPLENLVLQDFMITYRKPPSLRDMLARAKIAQPRTTTIKGCNGPNTCKYCGKISQSGRMKNLNNNNKTYNTITNGTCQSNNLTYCLECNWCHIKYIGQTRNRIIDKFQGHIFDIKHSNNTTVARYFHNHNNQMDPKMTIYILEYIRLPKDVPRSNSLRDNSELVWIHRLNTLIPNGLNILD